MNIILKIIKLFFFIQLMSIIIYFPTEKWIWENLAFRDISFLTNLALWGILFEKYVLNKQSFLNRLFHNNKI